jgi:catechol 2,3-dioxygenase-like lactoylglutathione lyase family enzyme
MGDRVAGAHNDLHSDQGARPGEHPGRSRDPVIKVHDIAWLEFEKPDLVGAEAFARAFGFSTVVRTDDELYLRGTDPGSPCVLIQQGPRSRFVAAAYTAQDQSDVLRLAEATGTTVRALPESLGGTAVDLVDPSGLTVRVVHGTQQLAALPPQPPQQYNFGHELRRINTTQRPPREPTRVQRLGHVVLQTTKYREALNWYLDHLGMIVSDFLYCDRGQTPADHHTLGLTLGPANRYIHSAYQVSDIDAMATGGRYLAELGYHRSWGIGRHILGSQIFDYWRDPDGFLVEHFSDGDMFDTSLEPGWAPFTTSGLYQWGPRITKDFLGIAPGRESLRELRSVIAALRADNEFNLASVRGLLAVAHS